jgi:hypothetical protein
LSCILFGVRCVVIGRSRVVSGWLGGVVNVWGGFIDLTLICEIAWLSLVCVCGVLGRLCYVLSWVSAVIGVSFVVLIDRLIIG